MEQTSRNNSWVRIALVLLGIYAALKAVWGLDPIIKHMVMNFPRSGEQARVFILASCGLLATPIALLACGGVLIRWCDRIAGRINPSSGELVAGLEKAAYTIASTFCGIMVLSSSIPNLAAIAVNMCISGAPDTIKDSLSRHNWTVGVYTLLQTAIGAYLLIGAPRIVKWQMARSSAPACLAGRQAEEDPRLEQSESEEEEEGSEGS